MDSVQVYGDMVFKNSPTYHGSNYLEYGGIPDAISKKLAKKIENIIDKEVAKFEATCDCDICKEKRNKR